MNIHGLCSLVLDSFVGCGTKEYSIVIFIGISITTSRSLFDRRSSVLVLHVPQMLFGFCQTWLRFATPKVRQV
jgi:hypothetical protein